MPLAIAEHLGFGPAYLAAAGATVSLIAGYSASVLGNRLMLALAMVLTRGVDWCALGGRDESPVEDGSRITGEEPAPQTP